MKIAYGGRSMPIYFFLISACAKYNFCIDVDFHFVLAYNPAAVLRTSVMSSLLAFVYKEHLWLSSDGISPGLICGVRKVIAKLLKWSRKSPYVKDGISEHLDRWRLFHYMFITLRPDKTFLLIFRVHASNSRRKVAEGSKFVHTTQVP